FLRRRCFHIRFASSMTSSRKVTRQGVAYIGPNFHRESEPRQRIRRALRRCGLCTCGCGRPNYSADHCAGVRVDSSGSVCARGRPPQKGLNQCSLQEASSLEGDSFPQTHAGTFRLSAQRDRLKIFGEPPRCYCAEILDVRRAHLGEDLHRAQGCRILRSSLNAELACVTVLRIRTLCWYY